MDTIESIWEEQAISLFSEGKGYMKTLEKHLETPSRFNNDTLFNIAVLSLEKMFVALLAHHEVEALHHTPMALFREAQSVNPGLTDDMKQTAKLIASHESICSLDDKGYTTPTDDEMKRIICGLIEMKDYIGNILINSSTRS